MSRARLFVMLAALGVAASLFTGVASAQEGAAQASSPAKPKVLKLVRAWAYVGPRGYLGGATVTLRDGTGKVVATGKTSDRGYVDFDMKGKSFQLPLTATTSGGSISALVLGKQVLAVPFKGELKARVFDPTTRGPITRLDLISTAAFELAERGAAGAPVSKRDHDRATARVRTALGISKVTPENVLQYRNSDVGFRQMMIVAKRQGGFDGLVSHVAAMALAGKRVQGLRPPSANASAAIPARLIRVRSLSALPKRPITKIPFTLPKGLPSSRQSSTDALTSPCQVGVPSTSSSTGGVSDQLITDVAEVGMGTLMKSAGMPTTATNDLTGMALGMVGVDGGSVEEANQKALFSELDCLGDQFLHLSQQVSAVQLSEDIAPAKPCENALSNTNAWLAYQTLFADGKVINSSNSSLTDIYLPTWFGLNATCGGSITNMLWGTKGDPNSGAWTQLVSNTVGAAKWYSPLEIQGLQTFIAYWSMQLYQQMILTTEYYNWYGKDDAAKNAVGVTTGSDGKTYCSPQVSLPSWTYCLSRSYIKQAWPDPLYTDELGVIRNSTAINAIPIGAFAGAAITSPASKMAATQSKFRSPNGNGSGSATAVNPAWLYNYYLNFTPYSGTNYGNTLRIFNYGGVPSCTTKILSNCPGPNTNSTSTSFAWGATGWFNAKGVNPKGYGGVAAGAASAVQTFDNPQNTSRTPVDCANASDVNSKNGDGIAGIDQLFNALNQTPNGGTAPLSGLKSSEIAYWVNDGNSFWSGQLQAGLSGYMYWKVCFGKGQSDYSSWSISTIPTKPIFATLSGRSWWPGAAAAPNFYPVIPTGPQ